jgi:hypothetical protein
MQDRPDPQNVMNATKQHHFRTDLGADDKIDRTQNLEHCDRITSTPCKLGGTRWISRNGDDAVKAHNCSEVGVFLTTSNEISVTSAED